MYFFNCIKGHEFSMYTNLMLENSEKNEYG